MDYLHHTRLTFDECHITQSRVESTFTTFLKQLLRCYIDKSKQKANIFGTFLFTEKSRYKGTEEEPSTLK